MLRTAVKTDSTTSVIYNAIEHRVGEKVIQFLLEHECFCRESVMQDDTVQLNGLELICEIVDMLKFEVEWEDD